MFDAIAPRYDLVNRIMTFRMDVGWRRKTVREPRPARRVDGARPGVRHRRPVPRAGVEGPPPDRRRPVLRDAGRRPHRRAAGARRRPAAPAARRLGRRRDLRLRAAELREPPAVLRRAGPGGRGPAAASRCSRWPSRRTGCCGPGTASTSARSCRWSAALLSDPAAYRYLPRSVAYLPEPAVMLDQLARRRVRRRRPPPPVRRHRPADHRHEVAPDDRVDDRARRHHAARRPTTSTCWRWPAATASCSSGVGPGWPGAASRPASPGRRGRRVRSRRIEVDDEVGVARLRSGGLRRAALPSRARPPSWSCPRWSWGRADDGTRWVTTIAAAGVPPPDVGRRPARRAPLPQPSSVTVAARAARPSGGASWSPGPRRRCATRPTAGSARSCWPARCGVEADVPFDRAGRARAPAPGLPRLLPVPRRRLRRRQPRAAREPHAATSCGPSRWPAPRPRGGDPATDARLAASLLASPTYRHEHQITIDMVLDTLIPWCSYLDYEPEPSVVGVANVQHLATLVEGRLSQPAPSVLELVRGAPPDPGGQRLAPRRGAGLDRGARGLRPRPLRRHGRLGRRRAATAPSRSASAAPTSTAPRPAWSPATASSPTATPTPSSPRPRSSSKPCSAPSPGSDHRLARRRRSRLQMVALATRGLATSEPARIRSAVGWRRRRRPRR